jgi:hypothetical protein
MVMRLFVKVSAPPSAGRLKLHPVGGSYRNWLQNTRWGRSFKYFIPGDTGCSRFRIDVTMPLAGEGQAKMAGSPAESKG